MKRHPLLVAVVAAVALITAAVTAQDRFTETVQVTIIEVPVTVADRSGKAIRGLTRENFEVYDDGKRVPIEYFDVVDLRTAQDDPQRTLPAAARRNFLLLFDLANSSPGTIRRAQDAAREFVTDQMGSLDLAAVATSSAERGLNLLTTFTNDQLFLIGTIETLTHEAGFKVADPLMLTALESRQTLEVQSETDKPAGQQAKEEALQAKAEERKELNSITDQMNANEMRVRVQNQIKNFGSVARALDRLRGQKQIILLSEGFDPRLITGREELGFQATQAENDAVLSGEIWKVDTDQRFGSATGTREITEMAELFRRSDVRLHAIDIKGIRTGVDAREGVRRSSNEGLSLLARPTGGTVFRNANDMRENFSRMLASQEVVYVLGFRAQTSGQPKFRPLRVKLVNVPGGQPTHRAGYYEPTAPGHELERTLTAAEIMMNNIPVDDVKVSAIATPFLRADGIADVPVIVEVDGKTLLKNAKETALPIEFFIYAFDERDLIRDHVFQRVTLDLSKLRTQLSAAGAKFYHTLRLKPGNYSVRVLVRARGIDNGLRDIAVKVPEAGATFVAPPLVFDNDVARWVMIRGPQRPGVSAEYPFQVGEKVFVPAASPILTTGQKHEVAVFAFNARENIDAAARVGANAAEVTLVGRAEGAGGMEKLLLSIEPPRGATGPSALVVTVRGKSGAHAQDVSVPVVVR